MGYRKTIEGVTDNFSSFNYRAAIANTSWIQTGRRPTPSSTTTSVTPPTIIPGAGSRRVSLGLRHMATPSPTRWRNKSPDPHPPPLPPLPPLLPHSNPSPAAPGPGHPVQAQGQPDSTPSLLTSDNHSQQTLYRPPSSLGTSAQVPAAGFSSFVWYKTLIPMTTHLGGTPAVLLVCN